MIKLPQYAGKNVAVFGIGKTGLAVIESLRGANIYAWDDDHLPDITGVNLSPPDTWPNLDALVLSPGIPLQFPEPHPVVKMAQQADCPIISDLDLLYEARPDATFVGITGTNGKSTTSDLIQHILQYNQVNSALGGNIGIPALSLADNAEIYVLEASSYQLELASKITFDIAVLLTITPDHLERHGNMENYIACKQKIFSKQGLGIISIDSNPNQQLTIDVQKRCNIATQSLLREGISLINDTIYQNGEQVIKLKAHEIITENLVAAYATCLALGLEPEKIIQAIATFKSRPHTMEHVANIGHISFINDSKATNGAAAQQALLKYKNIYWIAGGRAKAGGINDIQLDNVQQAFLIGEALDEFADTLDKKHCPYTKSYTLQQAVQAAYRRAKQTQDPINILFSPACSSFDQWPNFAERGNAFKSLVWEIEQQKN